MMLENCIIQNILQFNSKHDISDEDSMMRPVKKRHIISDLPLKKRYQQTKNDAMIAIPKRKNEFVQKLVICSDDHELDEKSNDPDLNLPVDFSLPNRIRAIYPNSLVKNEIIKNEDYSNLLLDTRVDVALPNISAVKNSDELATNFSDYLSFKLSANVPEFGCLSMIKDNHLQQSSQLQVSKIKRRADIKNEKLLFAEPQSLPVELSCNKNIKKALKNMTTERRMEANARERTRVHTISAAFEKLRKTIPAFSSEQKLSKLSILRLACNYIMLLAAMNDLDYSADQRNYCVEECMEMFTETLNVEAKYKRF